MILLNIIHQDENLLVLNKPAGLVCHPTKGDEYSSLVSRVRLHLGRDSGWHLINRLDRETSGLTLVALNDPSARQLRRQWENRQVEKYYLAIVHGHVGPDSGAVEAPLGKDEASLVVIKDCVRADGALSRTEFQVERRFERLVDSENGEPVLKPFSLLKVRLCTGRKHQIRIHLAHLGHPIVGDKLYGGDEDLYLALVEDRLTPSQRLRLILPYQALHAGEVSFEWQGSNVSFQAPPEPRFLDFVSKP